MSKNLLIVLSLVALFLYLGISGKISFNSSDSAIAKNAAMQNMFKQAGDSSKEDKKEAEESFMSKYFNINF